MWAALPGHSEVHPALLRAWEHTGQYVVGAYLGDDLVAASAAFLSDRPRPSLHSHITGVRSALAGRGIGAALKWHQRDWALARGIGTVTWTFDPLIARNAHFNLTRLGARLVEYLPDFYGPMPDARNAGQPSDRVLVRWDLESEAVCHRVSGPPPDRPAPEGTPRLSVGRHGEPVEHPGAGTRIEVPPDIEALRVTDPALALRWRLALRRALPAALGGPITFHRSAYLIGDPS